MIYGSGIAAPMRSRQFAEIVSKSKTVTSHELLVNYSDCAFVCRPCWVARQLPDNRIRSSQ